MRLPLACWYVNTWAKYMLARLPFNHILEILSDKIHIFKVICCLHLKYRIQFEHWWFIFSILNKSAFDRYGKQGCTPWFEFCCANMLVLLNCKSSFFSEWRKSQGKKTTWKGRWRIKLKLLWLFWLEMSDFLSERRDVPAAFWLYPFGQLLKNEF